MYCGNYKSVYFFFSSRRRHTRLQGDWSSDVCSSDLACDRDSEEAYRRDLDGGLGTAAYHRDMRNDEIDDVLHRQGRHGEIEALHPQGRTSEDDADASANQSAADHRQLERHARTHEMHRAVGAHGHNGTIAEMDLACSAHQEIEAERRRRPDNPRQQIADEVEPVDEERCRDQKKKNDQDQPAIERKRPELALVFISGVAKSGAPVQHQTLSMCSRPNRP